MFVFLIILWLAARRSGAAVQVQSGTCRASALWFAGRMRAYNGNPTYRIWKIGTQRILGVTGSHPGEEPILPDGVACGFDCDVYADFEVCPFTREKPGVMQRVCVESAANRRVVRSKP